MVISAIKKWVKPITFVLIFIILLLTIFKSGYSAVFYGYAVKSLPIYSVEKAEKEVSLTFDCAWGTTYTQSLLDLFDFYNIKVTFFMVEFWANENADLVLEIHKRGHEIGTHSKTHKYMSKLSKEEIVNELTSSKDKIESIIGAPVCLFRAPFGDYNNLLIDTATQMGLYTIQWDVDSLDWKDYSKNEISNRVLNKVKEGSIVLMHNNGLHTAQACEIIIPTLLNKGYTFKRVSELIYKADYEIMPDGKQVKK